MQIFYAPQILKGDHHLDEIESKHCVKVLRKQKGDEIFLLDGNGGLYRAALSELDKKSCAFEILEEDKREALPYRIHIAIAPPKQLARLEWFLEKSTEIGIHEISLVRTTHSERDKVNLERLEKILVSALKQSGNRYLPTLNPFIPLERFLNMEWPGNKSIACMPEKEFHLNSAKPANQNHVLIGPEGGFADSEIQSAEDKGWKKVNLGPSRLRTETAALVACQVLHFQHL